MNWKDPNKGINRVVCERKGLVWVGLGYFIWQPPHKLIELGGNNLSGGREVKYFHSILSRDTNGLL